MGKNNVFVVGLLSTAIVLASCYATGESLAKRPDTGEMMMMASRLTKLSAAVESTVRYKNPSAGLDENGLLHLSVKHDPQLLENFADFKVKVLSQDRHAIVLICSKEGDQGLLEDAGCTSTMDRHHWRDSPQSACSFTMNAATDCPKAAQGSTY